MDPVRVMINWLVGLGVIVWTVAVVLVTVQLVDSPTPAPHPFSVDVDGRIMVPRDLNGDGLIIGDIELGS